MNADIRHFWELLWGMTEKELRARYKNTIFGFLWMGVNPILQMFVIGFVFTFFMKEPVEHYNFFLFINLLVWNFFSLSLTKATPSIVFERGLISKSSFPRAVIPISIILSNFINFFVALLIFMIPSIYIGVFSFSRLPYVIAAIGYLLMFTCGVGLLTSALNVRYRDVYFFIQALLILWFYATPLVYSLSQMPKDLLWLWRFNPLASIVQLFQHAILGSPLPGPAMLASNITVTVVVTAFGILIFRDESKFFDDWI